MSLSPLNVIIPKDEYREVSGQDLGGGRKWALAVVVVLQTVNILVMTAMNSDLIYNDSPYQLLPHAVVFLAASYYLILWVSICLKISQASDFLIDLVNKVNRSISLKHLFGRNPCVSKPEH